MPETKKGAEGEGISARRLVTISAGVLAVVTFLVGFYVSKVQFPQPSWTPFAQSVITVSSLLLSFSGLLYVNVMRAIREIKMDLVSDLKAVKRIKTSGFGDMDKALVLQLSRSMEEQMRSSFKGLDSIGEGCGRTLFEMFALWAASTSSALVVILSPPLNFLLYDALLVVLVYGAGIVATNFVLLLTSSRSTFQVLQSSLAAEADLFSTRAESEPQGN